MKNQVVVRAVLGLCAILALYGGYLILKEFLKDPDTGSLDSTGMVAAVEFLENGSQLVYFDPSGKKHVSPDYTEGSSDIEPVWRPDGQRIFFSSNRGGKSNSIFRWNIATDVIDQRSLGTRSEGALYFGPLDWPNVVNSGLITAGGTVQEFDQREKLTKQILPPTDFEMKTTEDGQQDLAGLYQRIGTSFKSAKWGKDRLVIYSVMEREDDEVFVLNYMQPIGQMRVGPVPLFAGESIDFEVAPDGTAVIVVQGFAFPDVNQVPPEFVKDGKLRTPFRNSVTTVRINEDGSPATEQVFTDAIDLGLGLGELSQEQRAQYGVPGSVSGMLATNIGPASPAEAIGMQVGDVIVSVNGEKCTNPQELALTLSKILVGDKAAITFYASSGSKKGLNTVEYEFGPEPTLLMTDVAISPDSKSIAVSMGRLENKYKFTAFQLALLPLKMGGVREAKVLIQGPLYEPSWSPSGDRIVYTKIGPSGDSQIYSIKTDGSDERNLSGPGDFGNPKFSPMNGK